MTTTSERLNAIELRVEHATEGLWQFGSAAINPDRAARETWLAETCSDGDSPLWATWVMGDRGPADVVIPAVTGDGEKARANAEFIAHAHEDVRAMAAALFSVLGLVANVGNESTGPEFVVCYEVRDAIDAALAATKANS